MKKRLLLFAFSSGSKPYILDEPFTLLDSEVVAKVIDMIIKYWDKGSTILIATHYLPKKLIDFSHTIILFENAKIVSISTKVQRNQQSFKNHASR